MQSVSVGRSRVLLLLALSLLQGQAAPSQFSRTGVLAENTPFATPFYVKENGQPGPAVLVVGGIHGDEPAGAAAADQIRHWPIIRGKLIVIPRANQPALQAGKRLTPGVESAEANLNRDFPQTAKDAQPKGELAKAIWEFVRAEKPAWLIDLHEGTNFRASTNRSVGNSIIPFMNEQTGQAATQMLAAVNSAITNEGRRFVLLRSPVRGSLARAAGEQLGINTLILETTSKGQPLSRRTRQHRILLLTLLRHLEMIDETVTSELTDGLESFVTQAVRWAAAEAPPLPLRKHVKPSANQGRAISMPTCSANASGGSPGSACSSSTWILLAGQMAETRREVMFLTSSPHLPAIPPFLLQSRLPAASTD